MMRTILITFVCFCIPLFVSAQATEDFTIRVFGSVDTQAPSTTTIQSVVPVAFSQIDITWATSTDNFLVFGYVLSRDGVPIATTTETFYSDTGLMASTTYSYSVQAFDGVPNYSSSSPAVATTTPDIPVTPVATTTPPQQGTAARVVLDSLTVDAQSTAADVAVVTRRPARIEIRLGETSSYEIGYVTGTRFARDHSIPLNDLRPDTLYYYEVYGYTPIGSQTLLRRGSFTTLSNTPVIAPANVSAFTSVINGQAVDLTWELPASLSTESRVRIVRSHYGYPTFINDGVVIYEGVAEQATDQGVLSLYDRVYYTAFVIDPNGRVSSGAITQVILNQSSDSGELANPSGSVEIDEVTNETRGGDDPQEVVDLNMPDPSDIIISQLSESFTMASDTIPLSSDTQFTVAVPSQAIVGDFKTIIATLADPRGSNKTFSFLLRLNSDRTTYEATIAAVQVSGTADFTLEIYDYDSLVVGQYKTQIVFTPGAVVASSTLEVLWWNIAKFAWYGALVTPFAVLGLLWFLYRRREEE